MGVEIDYEKLPGIQKKIIDECCKEGKRFGSAARLTGCTFKLCDVAVSVVEGASAYISGCATEQNTVNKALFCRGASAFVVSSPNFKGKNVNVEKNNGLVIGL